MNSIKDVPGSMRLLQHTRPRTPAGLHAFLRHVFDLDIPRVAVMAGSTAPFEYVKRAFFESKPGAAEAAPTGADLVVWANRGGGKTLLGAVATVMDLLFKPGIQVRVLGGSVEQGNKMYEHLIALLDRPKVRFALATEPTARRIVTTHGSRVELLAGSQRSVRGVRVHKLRVDEVEELDREVWTAAQLTTRSGKCGDHHVSGTIEALSTMHRAYGLMNELVDRGTGADKATQAGGARRVMKWTVMDVIGRCPAELPCAGCRLWDDCRGRAKHTDGFMPVEDVLKLRNRCSDGLWSAEMMCERPSVSDSVYPTFDPTKHVHEEPPGRSGMGGRMALVAGMDFGMRSPFVVLWAFVRGPGADATVHVVDEYERRDLTTDQNLRAIAARATERGWPEPDWIGVDPAGGQRNEQTAVSNIELLRAAGHRPRWRREPIVPGLERVRRRLDRGTLLIHPRCTGLIAAMRQYHFDPERPDHEQPVKDGPDHLCDALRYLLCNLETVWGVRTGSYL